MSSTTNLKSASAKDFTAQSVAVALMTWLLSLMPSELMDMKSSVVLALNQPGSFLFQASQPCVSSAMIRASSAASDSRAVSPRAVVAGRSRSASSAPSVFIFISSSPF